MDNKREQILEVLNEIIFPCCFSGRYLYPDRPVYAGVHAYLCAKEIATLLEAGCLVYRKGFHSGFKNHKEGVKMIESWAKSEGLEHKLEVDISVGVADVIVYGDDTGIFEIGYTKPGKILLLLNLICKLKTSYTIHLLPYKSKTALIFKNWRWRTIKT